MAKDPIKSDEYVLNRIAVKEDKTPVQSWFEFQTRHITPIELDRQKQHPRAYGEAIVCGQISGGLEVIDIDTKYDPERSIHDRYLAAIPKSLCERLYVVRTPSGGAHIYFRSAEPGRNDKLATRYASEEELQEKPHVKEYCIIETRGEGGYAVAPPTPGYSVTQGSEDSIPFLTIEERQELIQIAKSFAECVPVKEPLVSIKEQAGAASRVTPWNLYNEASTPETVRDLLGSAGWRYLRTAAGRDYYARPGKEGDGTSGNYNHALKLFSVFSTNGAPFEVGKGYRPAAVLNVIQFNGNWSEAADYLISQGYGKPINQSTRQAVLRAVELLDGNSPEKAVVEKLVKEGHARNNKKAREILKDAISYRAKADGEFWRFVKGGAVKLNHTAFFKLLESWGFFRLKNNKNTYVRAEGKLLKKVNTGDMTLAINDYLLNINAPAEVEELFRIQAQRLLSPGNLDVNLKQLDPISLRDNKQFKFLPFRNGLAVMDPHGNVNLISYNEAPGYIWKDSIVPRDFTPDPNFVFDLENCEFHRFLVLIAGEGSLAAHEDRPRTEYFIRVFGYLCDTYKRPDQAWAVLLTELADAVNKGGGTGKGLFMAGVAAAANMLFVSGKEWSPDSQFKLSGVAEETRVVFIDDVKSGFNLDQLNNMVTDQMIVRELYRDPVRIPFVRSPRVVLASNYPMDTEAEFVRRRIRFMEFSNYFGRNRTPLQHFGHSLFDDWTEDEWNRFYNLVFYAVRQFRKHPQGLEDNPPSEAAVLKELRSKYGYDFTEWFIAQRNSIVGMTIPRNELYEEFLRYSGETEVSFSKKKFFGAMQLALMALGLSFSEIRIGNDRCYKILPLDDPDEAEIQD